MRMGEKKDRWQALLLLLFVDLTLLCALAAWNQAGRGEAMADAKVGRGEAMADVWLGQREMAADSYDKKVALTFDDGPHPSYTELLLDGLAERGVKATFFLIGTNIEGREYLVERMQEEGHLIGSHTYSHVQLTTLDVAAACEEIQKTNERILVITGQTPQYIRPPYGSWSEDLTCAVDMTVVLWSVDPEDWRSQNKDTIVRHIMKNTEDGDIILLHDVYKASVEAALEVVDRLQAEGYTFVTVDEMILD